jgi:hypothetical protein
MIIRTTISIVTALSINTVAYAQRFGVGFAYATSNAINIEVLYAKENNSFKLGASYKLANTRGKLVNEQLSNYGRTVDGTGKYFVTIDLGYGKTIKNKIQIDGELSLGSSNHFTNYIDNRFTGGGYHMLTKTEFVAGVGLNAGYLFNENWCVYTGFNTIRKLQFGVRWLF